MEGLLAGVRVVEISQVIAGPFAGVILADLGAEVIKVEKPNGGDDARTTGAKYKDTNDSLTFLDLNRGKKSVTIDFKSDKGKADFEALAASADILIHNQRPGVMKGFGIDGPTLCARHPRLIYCELSAFGHKGPLETTPGYEAIVQAYSGLSSINGFPDKPPVRTGASVCDLGTGLWTVIAAQAALRRRDLTGRGGIVNTSLFETALSWTGAAAIAFLNQGVQPRRQGTGFAYMVPYQTFDAADGPFVISAGNDRLFAKLAAELGHPEWLDEPKFATNRARLLNRDEIVGLIANVVAARPRGEWLARLAAAGVPCSPVNTVPEVLADPQVAALDMLQVIPGLDLSLLRLPLSVDDERPSAQGRAPHLGEHNDWLAALVAGKEK